MGEISDIGQPKTKVKITTTGNGYRFEFINGIQVEVSRINESTRAGTTTAELFITSALPATPQRVYQDRLNLTSASSKRTLRQELEKRIEGDFWQDILEVTCSKTLEMHRQGEPVEEISTEDEITRPGYLLHPLLMQNHPTVIYGLKGTAKSLVGLLCGIIIQLPMPHNPLNMRPLDTTVPVFYLDYETDKNEYSWRLKCLEMAMRFGYLAIQYRRCSTPLVDDIEQIHRIVNEKRIGLVIVDSLGPACGGADLNTSEPAIRYYNALRSLKVTTLTLAHTSKNPLSKETSIYGTVFFTNLARSIWELKKEQEHDDNYLEVGLYHRRCNYSKLFKPMGFRIDFAEDTIAVKRDDDNVVLQANRTNPEKILHCLLNNGAMTTPELVAETDITENTLRVTLSRLKKNGKLTQLGDKKWGVLIQDQYLSTL